MNIKEAFIFQGQYERIYTENSKGQTEHTRTYTNTHTDIQKCRKRASEMSIFRSVIS